MRPFTLFNPFSQKTLSDLSTARLTIQEIIYYAESRFWVILNEINKANVDRQIWTQTLLHRELVCSFVVFTSNV